MHVFTMYVIVQVTNNELIFTIETYLYKLFVDARFKIF